MVKLCLLTGILSCCFMYSFSQVEKIDTDRPDQTESAVTVPKNWIQLELGMSKQENKPGSYEFQHPTLLSKYGISNRIEFRLITTLSTITFYDSSGIKQKVSGLLPVELGAKISLWEEKNFIPKTSLLFHVAFPKLASEKLSADKLAPNFRFSMQHTVSKSVAIGYNIGAEWDGYNNVPVWIYTFAPGFNIGEKWYSYIEVFGFISKQDEPQHSIDGGIAYFVNSNFKLDLSSGFGISKTAPDWYVAIGGSIRFKARK